MSGPAEPAVAQRKSRPLSQKLDDFSGFRFAVGGSPALATDPAVRVMFVDHRGGPQLRLSHTIRAFAKKDPDLIADGYRHWLGTSLSVYPTFWRSLKRQAGTLFVCECRDPRCHVHVLADWLMERGARLVDPKNLIVREQAVQI